MRPVGEVAQALYSAAAVPGTVKDFCARARVGYAVGRYTASRMLSRGLLVPVPAPEGQAQVLQDGAAQPRVRGRRPVLLMAAQPGALQQQSLWAQAA